jgi:putative transposase
MLNKLIKMSRLPQIATPTRKPYPSDLSDGEWEILKPLLKQFSSL